MSEKEAEQTITLEFEVPGRQDPGFLIRQRRAMEFASKFNEESRDPTVLDEMVDFLADFVTVPAEREQAIDALWNASQEQFEGMLEALTGANDRPDPQSGGPSTNGS